MLLADLDFTYPPELVATEPLRPSRVLLSEKNQPPREMSVVGLLELFRPGDVLVINDTKVLPLRLFADDGTEVLFVKAHNTLEWDVLFPAREFKIGDHLTFPDHFRVKLIAKGLPQRVQLERELSPEYMQTHGQLALPPYIQEARQERHSRPQDREWYQTAWAENPGSSAAPTASLHFSKSDLSVLESRGVKVKTLTLHVGLGTFLPIKVSDLDHHRMHYESVFIPQDTWNEARAAREEGRGVWALGTTVTRSLESAALGKLTETANGFTGETDLFIRPGDEFQIVNRLLTNFHQPKSTLLALVMAFAGVDRVKSCYEWAIQNKFRLFSYGDLSVWLP